MLFSTPVLAAALAVSSSSSVSANPLDSLLRVRSNEHDALLSPAHKENKWLMFPQQQEMHAMSADNSLRGGNEIVSPDTFFKDHRTILGADLNANFRVKKQFQSNGGAVTHQRYEQYVSDVLVYGGDFHLTVGSHNGGKIHVTVFLFLPHIAVECMK